MIKILFSSSKIPWRSRTVYLFFYRIQRLKKIEIFIDRTKPARLDESIGTFTGLTNLAARKITVRQIQESQVSTIRCGIISLVNEVTFKPQQSESVNENQYGIKKLP